MYHFPKFIPSENSRQVSTYSKVGACCLLNEWMNAENYDILENFDKLKGSVFLFLIALVEDASICLQACSSLHTLSSSLPDDLLQRYGLKILSFDSGSDDLEILLHLYCLFHFS